jgi:hypothetical protein
MRDSTTQSTTQVPFPRRSPAHDAVDVALLALEAAHRRLAAAPVEFLTRSGLLSPPLADLGRWHDAQLRLGYATLIAANRCAGALALSALGGQRRNPRHR